MKSTEHKILKYFYKNRVSKKSIDYVKSKYGEQQYEAAITFGYRNKILFEDDMILILASCCPSSAVHLDISERDKQFLINGGEDPFNHEVADKYYQPRYKKIVDGALNELGKRSVGWGLTIFMTLGGYILGLLTPRLLSLLKWT